MNHVKLTVLLLGIGCLSACGRQVVEFEDDAGTDAGGDGGSEAGSSSDATSDDAADALTVPSPDDAADATLDGSIAAAPDASADGTLDMGVDGALETSTDASPDTSADASSDAGVEAGGIEAGGVEAGLDGSLEAGPDSSAAPTVISTFPLTQAVGVSINVTPTATFSEAMDPTTITSLTFTLQQGVTSVLGVVTLDAITHTATFTPAAPLGLGLVYTATITTGAKDLAGRPLAAPFTWTFTTSACSQLPVVLGSAANFVVLAGSTITSTGLTSVTGDIGVSPGTAITGFPPGTVVGAQHAGDPTSAQGIADLTTAYNDAAGRTLCAVTVAGNLGGQTLTPGLYTSTSSLAVSAGDLTLDAQGDGNAVFIFQMASTLTTTAGRLVILSGGAKAANVYWQVGTSATFGTTSAFQGTVMADQAITLNTGATLDGRALARIGGASLDSNVIVKPAP